MNALDKISTTAPDALSADGHTEERCCLNCGAVLVGAHCHGCGQKAHVHRSLGAFGHDLLHGVFHFEGKIWHTLPMLLWRPGELTRRYIEGERARFVSPLALFLFSVFLMFAVVSWTGGLSLTGDRMRAGIEKEVKGDRVSLARLEADQAAAATAGDGARAALIEGKIKELRNDISVKETLARDGVTGAIGRASDDLPANRAPNDLNVSIKTDESTPALIREFEKAYLAAKKDPAFMFYKLKSNGYKYSWALIPLSLPLMWLLFPLSRRFHLYDHAVFVTYSLCFVTLLVIIGSLLVTVGVSAWPLLAMLIPWHMYRQLRGAYLLTRFSAMWRTLVLTVGALVIALFFAIGIVVTGVYD